MSGVGGPSPSGVTVPAAKLAAPRPLDQRVRRDRLLDLLGASSDRQIIVVSAPAGHGKTTLLAELADRAPERTAWLSLDRNDHTAATFCAGLLAALTGCAAVPVDHRLHELLPPSDEVTAREIANEIASRLAGQTLALRLILDDVHLVAGSPAVEVLEALLARVLLGGGLQVVLSTRSDPALPLARWRVEGRLIELRRDALAFTESETRDLVARTGLALRPDQISTLVEQTGGWAAGLRLATMSLATTDDPDGFLTDLAGNDRAIADYLISEVLSRLPAESVALLRELSVCDQTSAAFALTLTDSDRAIQLLHDLERESSLVVSHGPGRQWYRIHPLLRAHLEADLRRSNPGLLQELCARAARWYAANGEPVEALRFAARTGQPATTAAVLHQHAPALLTAGRFDLLRDAWQRCPSADVDADPTLALVFALAFLDDGEASLVAELTSRADRALAEHGQRGSAQLADTHRWLRALVRTRYVWLTGELQRSPATQLELDRLPARAGAPAERALAHLTHSITKAAAGDLDAARVHATAALHAAELTDQPYVAAQATVMLAVVAVARGELRDAGSLATRADTLAPAALWRGTPEESVTSGIRCYAALMAGDPAHAIALAGPSVRYQAGELSMQATAALALMVVAIAHEDLGEHRRPLALISSVREQLPLDPLSRKVIAVGGLWEHEIALARGDTDRAREVLSTLRDVLGPTGDVAYLAARTSLTRGRCEVAKNQLDTILDGSLVPLVEWVEVAARVEATSVALQQRCRGEVHRQLSAALDLASRQGALRPLLTAPEPVISALSTDRQLLTGEHAETIATVLGLRPAIHLSDASPLTPREQEVLAMLPSLCTVGDIAADLSLSANTVKTHLRSIYGKLGVDSRRKAVDAGRRFGYLAS